MATATADGFARDLSPDDEFKLLRSLASIVEDSPLVPIRWRLEPGWPVEYVGRNILQFGYRPEELLSGRTSLWDLVDQDSYARSQLDTGPMSPDGVPYRRLEYRLKTRTQGVVFVRFLVRTVHASDGRISCEGLMGKAQESIEHEERLRLFEQAVDTTHNGIVIADATAPDFPIIFANRAVERITGYRPDEFVGRNCRFLQRGQRDQPGLAQVREALRKHENCEVVVRNFRKDGTPFWNEIRISPVTDRAGKVTHFIGVQADITARKDAEETLARRDAILVAISLATETLLRAEDYTLALPRALRQIGEVTRADHLCVWRLEEGGKGRMLSMTHTWNSPRIHACDVAAFQQIPWGESHEWSVQIVRDGKSLQGNASEVRDDTRALLHRLGIQSFLILPIFDRPNHLWGVLSFGCAVPNVRWSSMEVEAMLSATRVLGAVIQNRETSEALRLSEQRFRTLNGVSPVGIFETNATGQVTYTNRRLQEIFDISETEFTDGSWRSRFTRQDLAAIARSWRAAIKQGRGFFAEFMIRQRTGNVRWVKAAATPLQHSGGDLVGYVGTVDDVTNYHLTNQALRESEVQYRSLVTSLKEVVFQTDAAGRWTYLNPAWTEITGFSLQQTLGQNFLDYVHPADRDRNNALFLPLVQRQKEYCRHQVRYLTKNGGFRWIEVFARLTLNDQDRITGTAGTLSDITDRKLAEETQRRQSAAIEAAIDAVSMVDLEHRFIHSNPTHTAIFGYADEADLLGRHWSTVYPPEEVEARRPEIEAALTAHGKWRGISRGKRKDGSLFDLEMSLTRIEGGGMACVCRDITERIRVEKRMQEALREKEVMLKEIHHRVKNNMQIVSSLLNLQLETIEDEGTRAMFIDSQNRIASMALVHEKLYRSADLARIDFSDYVRDLTENLVSTQGARAQGVQFRMETDDLHLSIDTAIPCGLIINELVSNSYKHGFPNGGPGSIELKLMRGKPGWITLEVADSGPGLPEGLDLRRTRSLGMQLIHTLVQQLRGKIELQRHPTRFILQLQEAAQKKPTP